MTTGNRPVAVSVRQAHNSLCLVYGRQDRILYSRCVVVSRLVGHSAYHRTMSRAIGALFLLATAVRTVIHDWRWVAFWVVVGVSLLMYWDYREHQRGEVIAACDHHSIDNGTGRCLECNDRMMAFHIVPQIVIPQGGEKEVFIRPLFIYTCKRCFRSKGVKACEGHYGQGELTTENKTPAANPPKPTEPTGRRRQGTVLPVRPERRGAPERRSGKTG